MVCRGPGGHREGPERLHQLRRTAAIAQPGQLCPVGHSRIPRNMRLAAPRATKTLRRRLLRAAFRGAGGSSPPAGWDGAAPPTPPDCSDCAVRATVPTLGHGRIPPKKGTGRGERLKMFGPRQRTCLIIALAAGGLAQMVSERVLPIEDFVFRCIFASIFVTSRRGAGWGAGGVVRGGLGKTPLRGDVGSAV